MIGIPSLHFRLDDLVPLHLHGVVDLLDLCVHSLFDCSLLDPVLRHSVVCPVCSPA